MFDQSYKKKYLQNNKIMLGLIEILFNLNIKFNLI